MQAHFQMSAREFASYMQAVVDEATRRAIASSVLFRWVLGSAAVFFVIGASLNWSEDRLLHGISWFIMLVSGALIFFVFYRQQSGLMHSIVSEGGLFTQPTTIEISPEHLLLSNRLYRTELLWKAIRRFEESEYHLTIYVDNMVVYFIPKRAFSSQAEFQAFLDRARRWSSAASGPWSR